MEESVTIEAVAELMDDLRQMARGLLSREQDPHAVRPTALVISALRRSRRTDQEWGELTWSNRDHFFGSMYREMRRALTDYARKRKAMKRPPLHFLEPGEIDLYHLPELASRTPEIYLLLEEALAWVSREEPEIYLVLTHHYFSGLTVSQIAALIEVSEKTVKRQLARGRLMLHRKIMELDEASRLGPT